MSGDCDQMKINDIINEASILDKAKGAFGTATQAAKKIGRAVTGAKAGYQQAQGARAAKQQAADWIQKWNQSVGQNPAGNTQQNLQAYANSLAQSAGVKAAPAPDPTTSSPAIINDYITRVVGQALAAPTQGTKTVKPTTTADADTQQTPAGIIVPHNVGGGARQQTQQPSAQQMQQQALAQGVQIKSQEPIIITTGKGKEFGLDDKGQWVHLASGKIPPQSFQQFLSQQHDISLGLR